MKNKGKFLFILMFVTLFLLYRVDSVAAMENIQPDTFDMNNEANVEAEQLAETVSEPKTEWPTEPALSSETEQPAEPVSEPEVDFVTTGAALIEWLESHKNTGGTVKLADNVVLEGYYSFCPDGPNMPSVFVDTDKYMITVAGEIELMSDDHLIFSGQPDGKSIFYVAEKGMLSMQGVAVESGQCALWQEEGAGLVVGSCLITGNIHYADTPFVIYYNDSICAIVENGQTADDVLPAQISCMVNRQGQVSCNEWTPVSWNLEGTEELQEERQRFQAQGSFLDAASAEPTLCTVVYNDHPLTFTDVKASASGCLYTFQGGYTMPEESLPATVMAEYSFDGENWTMYEEQRAADTNAGFYIALKSEQDNTAFDIYIRLQWNDNGTSYFSNVLCYAADDLEHVADIGGSRGGGTSITNPPDIPQESTGDTSSEEDGAASDVNHSADSNKAQSEIPSEGTSSSGNPAENGNDDAGLDSAGNGMRSNAEDANTDAGESFSFYSEPPKTSVDESFSFYSAPQDADASQPLYAEPKDTNVEQPSCLAANTEKNAGNGNAPDNTESFEQNDIAADEKEEEIAVASVYTENSADPPQIKGQTLRADIRENSHIVIAAGFVLLSAIAGIAGFCVHSRSGTKR